MLWGMIVDQRDYHPPSFLLVTIDSNFLPCDGACDSNNVGEGKREKLLIFDESSRLSSVVGEFIAGGSGSLKICFASLQE